MTRIYRHLALYVHVIVIVIFACVSNVGAQTLVEALTNAYNTNPGILSERASLMSTDEGVVQALGNWRPKVELSGDIEREYTENNTRLTDGEREQIRTIENVTMTVTQSLFRGFRTEAAVEQAENAVLSKRATLRGSEQSLLLDAASNFLTVLENQAVLGLNQQNEKVLLRQLQATKDRFRVGEITRTDVSQAEARVAGAAAARIKSQGDLVISRASYTNVVGVAPGTLVKPSALEGLPSNLEEAKVLALKNHPDMVVAELSTKIAREKVKAKRGELYPTLDMVGTVKRDWESVSNVSEVTTGEIKLDLKIPLYQKGAVFSGLRQAKIDARKTEIDLNETEKAVTEKVENAWESLKSARAQIKSFNAQIDAAKVALEGVEREAAVGSRTVLDVLDSEQELLDAKVSLIGAQRDEVLASFQLLEASGQLTAKKLGLAVKVYDPTNYYGKVRNKLFGADPPISLEKY